jgi:hypothetical protein
MRLIPQAARGTCDVRLQIWDTGTYVSSLIEAVHLHHGGVSIICFVGYGQLVVNDIVHWHQCIIEMPMVVSWSYPIVVNHGMVYVIFLMYVWPCHVSCQVTYLHIPLSCSSLVFYGCLCL